MIRAPVAVDEEGALAAHRLGDQRLLAGRALAEEEHRGVELHELQVGDPGPGPQRRRHAVAGRHRRVGRRRVDLPQAAGGEHDRPAVRRADPVDLPLADDVQRHPAHGTVVGGEQVDDEGVLDDLDAGVVDDPVERGDERARDLGAGRVAAGVRDPVAVVAALAGQLDLAAGVAVELGAERHELAHPVGPLGDQDAHGLASQSPTPATSVSSRCSCGVSSGSSAAAMPPWAQAVDPADSTVLVTSSTRSTRSRRRSAQVSPAMPEPTTTTSALVVHPGAGAVRRRGSVDGAWPASGRRQTSARACGTSENTSSAPPPGPTSSGMLSMRRVVPTRAATASRASPRYHSGTSARVWGCTSTR